MEQDAIFDKVMESIGNNGKFQKTFNILFNVVLVFLAAMPENNIVLAMSIPDHWCYVPGRNHTNFTQAEWKTITLPLEYDAKGQESVSRCHMFNVSHYSPDVNSSDIVQCQHGFEYDTTWYRRTAPSQQDWVCERELFVANTFVASKVGEVMGTFVFGQLGDMIGRRPVFIMSLTTLVVGRVLTALTSSWYPVFVIAAILGNLSITPVFQCPLVIAMEISHSNDRAHIALLQSIAWTTGMCVMPMLMWAIGDWVPFMLVTTIPCACVLFVLGYMIESPRWLASRGKTEKCTKQLEIIAKMNGTTLDAEVMQLLEKTPDKVEPVYGILSLFSSCRLAKNTILITGCWISTVLCLYTLILNITNMDGNPFLNFLWQSLVEVPAYILGKIACDRIGRRWTSVGVFSMAMFTSISIVCVLENVALKWVSVILAAIMRFFISISFYVVALQSMEIYPTCLRQTGISMGVIISNALGVLGPYIILMGTKLDIRYPFLIMALLTCMGACCGLFLPETLYKRLPETLQDAHNFGMNEKIFQLPRKVRKTSIHKENY